MRFIASIMCRHLRDLLLDEERTDAAAHPTPAGSETNENYS